MCFTLPWIESVLIWLVIVACVVGVLHLFIPWVLSLMGVDLGPIPQIVRIIVMAVIAIAAIIFVFDLLSCLAGAGGVGFLRLR